MRFLCLSLAVVAIAFNAAGCGYGDAAEDPLADEELSDSESALMGNLEPGSELETTARLNLRSGASTSTAVLLTMPLDATVTLRSSVPKNGFYQVSYGARAGWAHGGYLVEAGEGGAAPAPGPAPGGATGAVRQVTISGPRVRAHVQAFANASCAVNGCPFVIGTRAGHSPTADRAIDMMESNNGRRPADGGAHGTRVASYALSTGERAKVMYVIWQQRINSLDGRGWRGMADRGSITQNHFDHVHVSFDP
jgi:hypothetical protein